MKDAKRERAALTARAERKALDVMARAMPAPVQPDHLTAIGVLAGLGVGAGYALSGFSPHWLWLSSAMLVVNWFGDSLDGTLARFRSRERPRYGYYLDHGVDAFITTIIGLGIGLSPFVPLPLALGLVLLYLLMSINVYLEAHVYGVFRMDYGVLGPTEARIILIIVNTGLVFLTTGLEIATSAIRTIAALALSGVAALMIGLLTWRFATNLRRLARLEPIHGRDADPEADTTAATVDTGHGHDAERDEPDDPEHPGSTAAPAARSRTIDPDRP